MLAALIEGVRRYSASTHGVIGSTHALIAVSQNESPEYGEVGVMWARIHGWARTGERRIESQARREIHMFGNAVTESQRCP